MSRNQRRMAQDDATSIVNNINSIGNTGAPPPPCDDAGSVTVIQSVHHLLTKVFDKDGKHAYADAKSFTSQEHRLDGIRSLSALLTELERHPRKAIIRGRRRRATLDNHIVRRAKNPKDGEEAPHGFEDAPRRWVGVDVDDFTPDPTLGIDAATDPEGAIRAVLATLPQWLRDVTCHWQWSASAGVKGWDCFKLHLWFWLDTALDDASLKHAFKDTPVDASLFNAVQLHYTAAPIFRDGVVDPVAQRSGLLVGADDVGRVPDDVKGHRARLEAEKAQREAERQRSREQARERRAQRERAGYKSPYSSLSEHPRVVGYVEATVSRVVGELEGAGKGQLHNTAKTAARSLAGLVNAKWMSESDGSRVLFDHSARDPKELDKIWKWALANIQSEAPFDPDDNWTPTTRPVEPLEPLDPSLTIDDVRAQLHTVLTRTSADVVLGQFQCGVGKTTALIQLGRGWADGAGVRIIAAHTRQAAIRIANSIDRPDGVALHLGRSNGGAAPGVGWQPQWVRGSQGADTDLSNCGAVDFGVSGPDCDNCPLKTACSNPGEANFGQRPALGYFAARTQLRRVLKHGGVVVCTAPLLAHVLHMRDEEVTDPARVEHIYLDDVTELPGLMEATAPQLREAAQELFENPTAQGLVLGLAGMLDTFCDEVEPGPYGTDLDVKATRVWLARWLEGHHIHPGSPVRMALDAKHVPHIVNQAVTWLAGEARGGSAFLVRGKEGASLLVGSPPPTLPKCPVTVLSGTATKTPWAAWTGQEVAVVAPYIKPENTTGVRIKSSAWDKPTWMREGGSSEAKPPRLMKWASTHGEQLRTHLAHLPNTARALVVAHIDIIKSTAFKAVKAALLDGAQYKGQHTTIHWRSVDQVGCDAFKGYDAVIMCGTPVKHLGRCRVESRRVAHMADPSVGERWQETFHRAMCEREDEADGLAEQAGQRPRFLLPECGGVMVHIATERGGVLRSGHTLRRLCPVPVDVGSVGGRPQKTDDLMSWLKGEGWTAWAACLADLPNPPPVSKRTLQIKALEQSAGTRWKVQLSGRGAQSVWVGESREDVRNAVERLLKASPKRPRRPRRIVRIQNCADADYDGHVLAQKPCIGGSGEPGEYEDTPDHLKLQGSEGASSLQCMDPDEHGHVQAQKPCMNNKGDSSCVLTTPSTSGFNGFDELTIQLRSDAPNTNASNPPAQTTPEPVPTMTPAPWDDDWEENSWDDVPDDATDADMLRFVKLTPDGRFVPDWDKMKAEGLDTGLELGPDSHWSDHVEWDWAVNPVPSKMVEQPDGSRLVVADFDVEAIDREHQAVQEAQAAVQLAPTPGPRPGEAPDDADARKATPTPLSVIITKDHIDTARWNYFLTAEERAEGSTRAVDPGALALDCVSEMGRLEGMLTTCEDRDAWLSSELSDLGAMLALKNLHYRGEHRWEHVARDLRRVLGDAAPLGVELWGLEMTTPVVAAPM